MIITTEMLVRFDACAEQWCLFAKAFPYGLDVSGLWGDAATRAETWQRLLAIDIVKRNLGWAIRQGLVPARITGNFANANLHGADLRGADLRGADLRGADLIDADLSGANLSDVCLIGADLCYADLCYADLTCADLTDAYLTGTNLSGADLCWAIGYTA